MKQLDSAQEAAQRHLRTCLSRKKGYIDVADWQKAQALFKNQVTFTNNYGSLLGKGFIE
jgi:hypothetical protein